LEQIAKPSPERRAAIHELLAAYVRAESTWPHHDPVTFTAIEPDVTASERTDPPLLKIRAPDVQAAITVLGRRVEVPDEVIELQDVDLRHAYLGGANLRRVIMARAMLGPADLERADFTDAWLRRTNVRGADLTRAVLRGGNLSSSRSDVT
jgi:Pentapeptide repeats (8 copies)